MYDIKPNDALLVVDVQVDFCPGGALPVPGGDEVVPVVNRIVGLFNHTVATQDWHPPEHVSFASSHAGRRPFDTIRMGKIEQMLWPEHCVRGSPGAALHPALETRGVGLILRKGMGPRLDSYSAFFENDRTTPTGLGGYLREHGIHRVFLCGLAADVCVFHSCMDALRLGFSTFVVEDGIRGVDVPAGTVASTREEMERAGAHFVMSDGLRGQVHG
jgi:nicotinamidase/pyrazinamidase